MNPVITVEELYLQSIDAPIEILILRDIVPHLARSPGITGQALARAMGVRRSVLSGAVQLLIGQPLSELLRQWRLLHAMYLLSRTTLSYQEVALRCGYKTIDGLSKFLERHLKCTAREYREQRIHGNRIRS